MTLWPHTIQQPIVMFFPQIQYNSKEVHRAILKKTNKIIKFYIKYCPNHSNLLECLIIYNKKIYKPTNYIAKLNKPNQ